MPTSCYSVQQNNNNNKKLLQLSHVDPQMCVRAEKLNTALMSSGLCVNLLSKTKQQRGASEELRCCPPAGTGLPWGWPSRAATQCTVCGALQRLWPHCGLALSSCRDITLKDKFSPSAATLWSKKVQSNEQAPEIINLEVAILISKLFIIVPDTQFVFSVQASYLIWAETHSNHTSYQISMYNSKRVNNEE